MPRQLLNIFTLFFGVCLCSPAIRAAEAADSPAPAPAIIAPDTFRLQLTKLIRLGISQLEEGDPELARLTFLQAEALDSSDPRVFVGFGRSYFARKDRRLRIFQIIERFFDQDFLSLALKNLAHALELSPDNWEAHYWIARVYMKRYGANDMEKALEHMSRARELGGKYKDIPLKLAILNKALGNLRNAEQILTEEDAERSGETDPLVCLELAKINIGGSNYNAALRYYWNGVRAISTAEQFKSYFDDVSMLATRAEQNEFKRCEPGQAHHFLRAFWMQRDYDLGLSPGMRLIQHYSRLQVADSLYRVPFPTRNPEITPVMGYVPDINLPYDDRGIIYLRHGPPSRTLSQMGEGLYPNQTWVYNRSAGDLDLHFVALRGSHEYQLVTSLDAAILNYRGLIPQQTSLAFPDNAEDAFRLRWMKELYNSRMEIGRGIYFRLYNDPYDPFAHVEEYEENIVDLKTAVNSESVQDPYLDHLNSYYDLVGFRGQRPDGSIVDFYSGVPGREISFNTRQSKYYYDIQNQLMIYDRDWRLIKRLDDVEQYESSISPKELMDRQVLGLGRVELTPGDYYYFVKIQNGGSVGNYNGKIHVDAYGGDSLQASQIVAARNIFPSPADSSKFRRYRLEIEPLPSRTFHPEDKMYAYQEIYNLTPDNDGNYNYRLTYTISTIELERNFFAKVFDSFKYLVGAGPSKEKVVLAVDKKTAPLEEKMVQEDLAIDLSDRDNGLYERSFKRNTRFFVRK